MKFLTTILFDFLLLSNFLLAETIPTKSKILKQSSECFELLQNQVCKDTVSEIEKLQLVVYDQNKFKCQSSLLGLQSELVKAYFFKSFSKEGSLFMVPYVIKNC